MKVAFWSAVAKYYGMGSLEGIKEIIIVLLFPTKLPVRYPLNISSLVIVS